MHLTHKRRLYSLTDKNILCYYVENDIVKKQPFGAFNNTTNSPFLLHNPVGWKQEEIAFGTGEDFMLNRSFNLDLNFVYEGARIIRSQQYFGRGYEEEMYLVISKWDRETDEYRHEYKGKIDLSVTEDFVGGTVRVNSIEGGILTYLNANKNTVYEIACDETNPAIKLVLLDGMNLDETLNYSFVEADLDGVIHIVPLIFINNEGDHESVLYGNPTYEEVTGSPATFFQDSQNYIVKNLSGNAITFGIQGILKLKEIDTGGQPGNYKLYAQISSDTAIVIPNNDFITIPFPAGASATPFNILVTLAPGEKLFFYHQNIFTAPGVQGGVIKYDNSDFKISFISRKAESTAFCMTLYEYYKLIVPIMTDNKYTGESLYLQGRTDLVVTCGDALRNTDKNIVPIYKIASSFSDFFQSIPGDVNVGSSCGLQIRGDVLYCELLSDLYNDSTQIYDLGEVTNFRFRVATETICNTIQNGYPDQNYDTNGGKLEVNSEQIWQMPVISLEKVFDIRSKWGAAPREIERIRSVYTHLDTTDNEGDKKPFIIMISDEPVTQSFQAQVTSGYEATGQTWVEYDFDGAAYGATMSLDANNYTVRFTGTFNKADLYFNITLDNDSHACQIILFKNGQSIASIITTNTDGVTPISFFLPGVNMALNDTFQVRVIPFDTGFQTFDIVYANIYFEFLINPFTLFRLLYDSISGVVDNTVYNVELRPRNQIYAHGNELRGKLIQLQTEEITLNTAKKNTELVTVYNGVTKKESDPIPVSSLAPPLYLPYDALFTTQVPYNFTDLLSMSTAGYFTWTYEGYRFYGLPWGSMKSRPATSEAQEWQLRLSPKNLFSDIFGVSYNEIINFTYNNNMVATSIYSPMHWIKYNFAPQSKYHHIDMHEDWSYKRFNSWFHVPFYTQKWQLNDIIKIPLLTTGLGALNLFVYDVNGNLYDTAIFQVITTPYVKLPFILQQLDYMVDDEGLYLFVIKSGDENIWISEWCDIREDWSDTFLIKYTNSQNEKNSPWKAYNGYMELRVEAMFEQWEPDSEFVEYEDDTANFTILSGQAFQKRNMIIGHVRKVPEWMGLKVNGILLKDGVYIEGDTADKHYTRRQTSQMETTKYNGMPYLSYVIELIPAENPENLVNENIPVDEVNGWHATINAQVYGSDYGTVDLTILNQ